MKRYTFRSGIQELVMLLTAFVFAVPILVLFNVAFTPVGQVGSPFVPPAEPTLTNFGRAWTEAKLGDAILNSCIVTVFSVLILVIVSSLAAYTLARSTAGWSRGMFFVFMVGLLLPFQVALIPLYQTMRDLGLLGTPWSLVLFYSGVQIPFTLFLFTQFLRHLPRDYEEAAVLDGGSTWQVFWYVVFPLLRPVTGTVIIINGIFIWNDFFAPLLYLLGSSQQTIPVALYGFVGGMFVTQWTVLFAGLILGSIPILSVYFLLQRYIIQGFSGGLKG